jgi:general secretion pathway protein G
MVRRPPSRRGAGFSLIELMVVIAIMGLLATVVAVNLMGQTYKAKVVKVQADFDAMKKAVDLFKLNVGRYPSKIDDLWTAPGGAKGWNGPYIDPDPKDPWGNSYRYDAPIGGGKPKLTCYGEDGAPSGTGEAQDLTTENITQINTNLGN